MVRTYHFNASMQSDQRDLQKSLYYNPAPRLSLPNVTENNRPTQQTQMKNGQKQTYYPENGDYYAQTKSANSLGTVVGLRLVEIDGKLVYVPVDSQTNSLINQQLSHHASSPDVRPSFSPSIPIIAKFHDREQNQSQNAYKSSYSNGSNQNNYAQQRQEQSNYPNSNGYSNNQQNTNYYNSHNDAQQYNQPIGNYFDPPAAHGMRRDNHPNHSDSETQQATALQNIKNMRSAIRNNNMNGSLAFSTPNLTKTGISPTEAHRVELQQQMEENRRRKELEKQKERELEEREIRKFHEYQARIKAEEEEEQRKIRERARIAEERSRRIYEEQKEEQRRAKQRAASPPQMRNHNAASRRRSSVHREYDDRRPDSSDQPPQLEWWEKKPTWQQRMEQANQQKQEQQQRQSAVIPTLRNKPNGEHDARRNSVERPNSRSTPSDRTADYHNSQTDQYDSATSSSRPNSRPNSNPRKSAVQRKAEAFTIAP
ncbi:hypothetical protein WR25_08696 [Diploscapter pachys]|uniref:CCDC66 domain-containing protein n=1 Tax=Diploscapter pachys TaxID=2018661 RepID=A0A2A2L238_9BILA|nr:hypothetical protein WR25_08696 [Diploscapter pachys]